MHQRGGVAAADHGEIEPGASVPLFGPFPFIPLLLMAMRHPSTAVRQRTSAGVSKRSATPATLRLTETPAAKLAPPQKSTWSCRRHEDRTRRGTRHYRARTAVPLLSPGLDSTPPARRQPTSDVRACLTSCTTLSRGRLR